MKAWWRAEQQSWSSPPNVCPCRLGVYETMREGPSLSEAVSLLHPCMSSLHSTPAVHPYTVAAAVGTIDAPQMQLL